MAATCEAVKSICGIFVPGTGTACQPQNACLERYLLQSPPLLKEKPNTCAERLVHKLNSINISLIIALSIMGKICNRCSLGSNYFLSLISITTESLSPELLVRLQHHAQPISNRT